jgi:hypothetical protein
MRVLFSASVAAVLGFSTVGFAATHTVKFNGTDGETTSLWYGYAFGGSNIGTQQGQLLLARPDTDWYFGASLLRVKNLPPDLIGGTINSATFVMNDNFGDSTIYDGVEIHRINTPAVWKVGDGAQANRFPDTRVDNGAGRRVADWTGTSTNGREGAGVDWNGVPVVGVGDNSTNYFSFATLPAFEDVALAELIDTGRTVGPASTGALLAGETRGFASFDVTELVADWADGSGDINDGFAIWMGDATLVDGTNPTQGWAFGNALSGLHIDYTPVPEPASVSLLALGALVMRRRRNR